MFYNYFRNVDEITFSPQTLYIEMYTFLITEQFYEAKSTGYIESIY